MNYLLLTLRQLFANTKRSKRSKQKSPQLLSTNPPNRHTQSDTLSPCTENENDIIKNPSAFKIKFGFIMGEYARTIQEQRDVVILSSNTMYTWL